MAASSLTGEFFQSTVSALVARKPPTDFERALSMTFGRPAIITQKLVCLDLPDATTQMIGQTPQVTSSVQMDALFLVATM